MGKALKWIGIVLVVLIAISLIVREPLLERAVVRTLERELGGHVEIASVSHRLFRSTLVLDDLVLANPHDFPTAVDIAIRAVEVDYRFWGLWRDPVPLRRLKLDVERIVMPFDVQALMQLRGTTVRDVRRPRPTEVELGPAPLHHDMAEPEVETDPNWERPTPSPPRQASRRSVHIDLLEFRLGEIVMVMDYPDGEHIPIVLNLEQILHDVDNADQLALSISRALLMYQ